MNVLGFDYGSKLIGVALGNRITGDARGIAAVHNGERGPDWSRLDALLKEWAPQVLLVGRPLTLDGKEQPASVAAHRFADELARRYGLPVHEVDERYSSGEAARRFAERRASGLSRRKDAAAIDALAAAVIIETWLAENP